MTILTPMRNVYVLQPYQVGSKKSKSLALVIPAKVVKKYNINTSTAFALKVNTETNTIILQQTIYPLDKIDVQDMIEPTGESLQAINQQAVRAQ